MFKNYAYKITYIHILIFTKKNTCTWDINFNIHRFFLFMSFY